MEKDNENVYEELAKILKMEKRDIERIAKLEKETYTTPIVHISQEQLLQARVVAC